MRWRITGEIPNLSKFVVIVAPHTSNWDFVIGIAAKLALRLNVHWLGKHTLFRFPVGVIMRALGGLPVDRSNSRDVVADLVKRFSASEQLIIGLAPEGTRKKVERWRTGFYHIAHGARVPILPVALNWTRRAVEIGVPFDTTGHVDRDIADLQSLFAGIEGKPRSSQQV